MAKNTFGFITPYNRLILALGVPLLIIALSIGYYLVIFLPSYQRNALKIQESQFSKASASTAPTASPTASVDSTQTGGNPKTNYSQAELMTAYTNLQNNYKQISDTISQGERLIQGCSNSIFADSFGGYDQCVSKHQADNQLLQEREQQILQQMDQIKKSCPLCF